MRKNKSRTERVNTISSVSDIFPRANTIVSIEDSKLLRQPQYELLYNAEGLEAALKELDDINYFRTYKAVQPDNYVALFDNLATVMLGLLHDISPVDDIWRMFALSHDIHNMKLAVKERRLGQPLDALALQGGNYSFITVRSAAVRATDDVFKNKTLTKGLNDALYTKGATIDSILDKTYFSALLEFANRLKAPAIVEFITDRIDLFNVSAFLQAQTNDTPLFFEMVFSDQGTVSMDQWKTHIMAVQRGWRKADELPFLRKFHPLLEGAEAELFSLFDVRIDNCLIEKTKAAKLMAFGIEPICAYFFNKLMEMKNVRTLLVGKKNGFDTSEIEKRMRITYDL